jgi:TonB family protein
MKKWGVDRNRSCSTLQENKKTGTARPLEDPVHSSPCGLLKALVLSLLLHGFLVLVLVFGVQPNVTKNTSPAYVVTIRPLQVLEKEMRTKTLDPHPVRKLPPLPARMRTQREQNESVGEIRPKEVVLPEKEPDQVVPASAERRTAYVPSEELEPLSQPQEKEEKIREPIPLPMAASSDSNTNSRAELEENLHILLSSSRVEEGHKNTTLGNGQGEGPGTGSGGLGPGRSADGTGGGRGDSVSGGGGLTPGAGTGGSSGGGVGKSQGTGVGAHGKRGYGSEGSGNGNGSGRGGPGPGNSGSGGSGVPHPRYVDNPKPVYPREARDKRYEGEVLLWVEVLSNGRVGQIEVKKSSGYEMLDQSAFAAVKQWRFIPAMKGDVAIPFWVNIPIKFRLL